MPRQLLFCLGAADLKLSVDHATLELLRTAHIHTRTIVPGSPTSDCRASPSDRPVTPRWVRVLCNLNPACVWRTSERGVMPF
jgi:hypothetical protein